MSNFWELSDGSQLENQTEFDSGGGDFELIPANTVGIAAIEEAKWDGKDGDFWVSIRWRIARPEQFANRVIFQKLKVYGTAMDKDRTATIDKAKRMLAAIDANAGGCLRKVGAEPSDDDLMRCLAGKLMAIKIMVWKMPGNDGQERSGNWVSAVSPAGGAKSTVTPPPAAHAAPSPKAAPKPTRAPHAPASSTFDDELSF